MLKVAVIGLGDVSKVHLSAIQRNPKATLVAVCDTDETKDTIDNVTFYTDYKEMLDQETLDCVHICLPHYLHYPVTKVCVEKDIYVLLEKPISCDLEEAKQFMNLAEQHKQAKICVCFQNRFNETFEVLQNMIATEDYGQLKGVKGLVAWFRAQSYYEEKPWRGKMNYAGGGVMINQAIHTLDLMKLIGGDIQSIRGSIDTLSDYDIDVEDTATAKINFKNGATGMFFATNVNAENSSVEFEVTFEKAKFTIKDGILTHTNQFGDNKKVIEDAKLPGAKSYYGASHTKLINHFYTCIEEDLDDYVQVKDAVVSMAMIDTIRKSSETKQTINLSNT